MKKHRIALMLFVLCILQANGQDVTEPIAQLSESSFASVLTCGPGEEFYESFGHSAIRICDTVNNIDRVYNYGSFDFGEPHFYMHFIQGRLNYFIEPQDFKDFIFEYFYFGRAVWEQRLTLNHDELQGLYNDLEWNLKPENKYYKYDIFWDNCATRVRDIIEKNSDDYANFYKSDEKWNPRSGIPRTTYRDLIYKYTGNSMLWWRMGTDLLLGARCDRPMSRRQFLYMPIELMNQLDTIQLSDNNSLAETRIELIPQVTSNPTTLFSPALCFLLLFVVVIVLTLLSHKKGWTLRWLDALLFSVAGVVSIILLFLWFGSDHACTKWNFNILWANPFFIWMLCRLRKPCRVPATIVAVCICLALLIWIVGWPQQMNTAAILMALTLLVRVYNKLKRQI